MAQIKAAVAARRILRAESRVGLGTRYRLGKGGFDPSALSPGADLDCTGFISWVIQVSRRRIGTWWTRLRVWKGSPWVESTNIVRDATSGDPNSVFVRLKEFEPGCIVVYGDRAGREGHAALGRAGNSEKFTIIDCSSRRGDAIPGERSGTWMLQRGAIFVTLRQDLIN